MEGLLRPPGPPPPTCPASTSGGGRQTQEAVAEPDITWGPPGMNTAADIMVSSWTQGEALRRASAAVAVSQRRPAGNDDVPSPLQPAAAFT